jgi:hypothetical protein
MPPPESRSGFRGFDREQKAATTDVIDSLVNLENINANQHGLTLSFRRAALPLSYGSLSIINQKSDFSLRTCFLDSPATLK